MKSLQLVGLVALLAGTPPLVLFVGFYGLRSSWRQYPAGRALMYFAASLALAYLWLTIRFGLYLAGVSQEDTIAWQMARIVLFGAISASAYRLLYILIVTQRAPDRDGWTADRPPPEEKEIP